MIKATKMTTKVKGNINEVATDLAHVSEGVVGYLQKSGFPREDAIKLVKEVVEVGCMTSEERRAKADEQFDAFMDALRYVFESKMKPCSKEDTEEEATNE